MEKKLIFLLIPIFIFIFLTVLASTINIEVFIIAGCLSIVGIVISTILLQYHITKERTNKK